METKRCSVCHQEYPATNEFFYRDKSRNYHLTSRCKVCFTQAKKHWREQNRDKDRAASLRWQKNHPEKARARNKRFRDRHPEQELDRHTRNRLKNPDPYRQATRRWRLKHIDQAKAYWKRYRAANRDILRQKDRQRYYADWDKGKAKARQWQRNHPQKGRIAAQRRKARKSKVMSTFTVAHWRLALVYWRGCCAYCGNPPRLWDNPQVLHQDHFIPLSKGGNYTPDNILPVCQECNLGKRNNDPAEWLTQRFGKRKATQKLKEIQVYFDWIVKQHD